MSPFEALYGRMCNTMVSLDNPTNRVVVGSELLREMEEKMLKIKKNLKVSQDRQKAMLIRVELTGNLKLETLYS